jgi:hypothetical protein
MGRGRMSNHQSPLREELKYKYMKPTKNKLSQFKIDEYIISCDASYRGGILKVDVSSLFPSIPADEAIMGASQNYLGGGLRGSINGGAMFEPSELSDSERQMFDALLDQIKRYFHAITSDEECGMNDEWNTFSYEKQQRMPASAY